MSKPTIEHPKIFISYAWSSEEYQQKVLSFASDLVADGIDVQLDKWSLKEGNDTYAFMEQSVTDPNVTNVLLLLDEQYARKADSRSGGVGTETQIISAEIYNKVTQEKFIPIVFEYGENGEIQKPAYLKALLHFDLSNERYDDEYLRLVKRLYGIEIYQKPKLGNKPAWLDSPITVSNKTRNKYSILKSNIFDEVKTEKFILFLSDFRDAVIQFESNDNLNITPYDKYISVYNDIKILRDDFLELMQYVSYIKNSEQYIANVFEEIRNVVKKENELVGEIKLTLIHELFIYVIAIYYRNQNYKGLSYILGKTYFTEDYQINRAKNFDIFYFHNQNMDNAINSQTNTKYFSGTAQYWIDNLNIEVCSKIEYVFADLLCYNYSIYGNYYHSDWYWFPITYAYGGNENRGIRTFAIKLQSLEYLSKACQIFGYNNVQELNAKMTEIEEKYRNEIIKEYRYAGSFESAPILCQYIDSKNLGVLR